MRNTDPAETARQIDALYGWVIKRFQPMHFPDERDYFLAQLEMTAASCARWLGRKETCFALLDRAESRLQMTAEPETGRAEIMLLRLVVAYESHDCRRALAAIPELQQRLRRLGMTTTLGMSQILHCGILKDLGRTEEATATIRAALGTEIFNRSTSLRAFALEHLADCHALSRRLEEAATCLRDVAALTRGANPSVAACHSRLVLGEILRLNGDLSEALESYRAGREDFAALGMETWSAYCSLLIAEVLIAKTDEVAAQREILAVLPVIEKRRMVTEGFAAVALLRESIRRQKTDRNALRELADHLKGKR
jgi:hypothetical protein